MSLETVVEDIREEARTRAEEIREETEEEAAQVLAEAEADADLIIEEQKRDVEERIDRERDQVLSSAALEAKQQRLATRRDLLAELRESVANRIRDLEGDRREELTRALLDDAIEEFPADADVEVRGRSEDEELLRSLTAEIDRAGYAGSTDCLGGVVVGSDASRVTIDNTFDAVLDRMWEDNLKQLSTLLFDAEQ